jgi:sporulation protein YlmC with PRC-barrel domain
MNSGTIGDSSALSRFPQQGCKRGGIIMMIRRILTASIASGALAIAGPALAGPGHNGGHGGLGGGVNAGANMGAAGRGATHANTNSALLRSNVATPTTTFTNPATGVSQGPNNASTTGIANANSHSVLAGGSVSGTLSGLTTGLSVMNANGTAIGTVSQIITDRNGNLRMVIVTDASTGQTFRLPANTLSINGTMVTTTSTLGG